MVRLSLSRTEFSVYTGGYRAGRFLKLLPFFSPDPPKPEKTAARMKYSGRIAWIFFAVSFSPEMASGHRAAWLR
jgi:hypothetical protein